MWTKVLKNSRKIVYSRIPECRYDEFARFMAFEYERTETVTQTLDLYPNGYIPQCVVNFHRHRLNDGASLFAYETDTNRIVGVLTSAQVKREDSIVAEEIFTHMHSWYPEQWDGYVTYRRALMGGCNSVQELCGRDRIFHMHDMLVIPEYRKLGVGHELLRLSFEIGKAGNFQMIAGITTTLATYRMFNKLGFEIINKVRYRDIIVNGRPLLEDPDAFVAYMGYSLCKNR